SSSLPSTLTFTRFPYTTLFRSGPRGPRKEFGDRPQRGETKPWQKRGADGDRPERSPRAPREGGRSFERPRSDRPREDRPKFDRPDRKSTRLNSSHVSISYAVFC